MSKTSAYSDNLRAADKQAGFDYQFYIFLLKCLEIKLGQVIGYEEKDDVHIDFNGGTTFIQIKHTIGFAADGERPNLTQKDSDLWKTISNWVQLINDTNSGRAKEDDQLKFIGTSDFILASNKSFADTNSILELFKKFNASEKNITELRTGMGDLITETDSAKYSEVDKYILKLTSQSDVWLSSFINKVSFSLDIDDIVNVLKAKIKERFMIYSDQQCEDVFRCLFTNLKTETYKHVSQGHRSIVFDYDTIKGITSTCLYTINKPKIRNYSSLELPNNLEDQNFIKELIAIGDIVCNDKESIVEFTKFKVLMAQNMKDWEQNHELLDTSKNAFIEDCINKWKNIHRKHHRNPSNSSLTEEQLKSAGLACIDEIRSIGLNVSEVNLDVALSNGQFYSLSDELKIGWAHTWKSKYTSND